MITRQQLLSGSGATDSKMSNFCQWLNHVNLTRRTITLFGKRKPSLMDEVNDIIVYSYRQRGDRQVSIGTGFLLRFIPSPTGHRNAYGDYLRLQWDDRLAIVPITKALVDRLKVELEPLGYMVKPGLCDPTTDVLLLNAVTISW